MYERMEPGSVIYFVDSSHYVVLAGGIYYDSEEKIEELKQDMLKRIAKAEHEGSIYMGFADPDEYMLYSYGQGGALQTSNFADTMERAKEYAMEWYTALFPMEY